MHEALGAANEIAYFTLSPEPDGPPEGQAEPEDTFDILQDIYQRCILEVIPRPDTFALNWLVREITPTKFLYAALDMDRLDAGRFKALLKPYVVRHLDLTRCGREQDMSVLRNAVFYAAYYSPEPVVALCPLFEKYEDGWAVDALARRVMIRRTDLRRGVEHGRYKLLREYHRGRVGQGDPARERPQEVARIDDRAWSPPDDDAATVVDTGEDNQNPFASQLYITRIAETIPAELTYLWVWLLTHGVADDDGLKNLLNLPDMQFVIWLDNNVPGEVPDGRILRLYEFLRSYAESMDHEY
ncbi:hypothetical protein CONPUDRAFT_154382 [Coniophora puteana RWD-64-598 SS2]|uniref:Uncharacterized protein n=1 Tax=Coniophora puteana (strain RWD-64-598) TaxID=741705 RepID=A0A5M3MME1_CONPW|nr:uncharacterized protein CONPUDRAFT_154382 [Coniophora puteana RWD-64-598 SS2]EIW80349.1 hypothetical protein CONPUDRAFT_154382 [Coniophora puteana RWD-64-598 SS2]